VRRIFAEACGLGSYLFIIVGGEPLLVPGLLDALAERQDGLFLLFTNGTLLDDGHVARLARSTNVLPVLSFEGDGTLTDLRRGGGVGEKVVAAMAACGPPACPSASPVWSRGGTCGWSPPAWFDEVWAAGARFGFLIDYVPFPQNLDPSLVLSVEDLAAKKALVRLRYEEGRRS